MTEFAIFIKGRKIHLKIDKQVKVELLIVHIFVASG
jgi:hypothetical protein